MRIDHVPIKGKLLRVWQALYRGGVLGFKEVTRRGTRAHEYVQRVDPAPIHTTTNRKWAPVMGRYTAEEAVKSLQKSRCIPELESYRSVLSIRIEPRTPRKPNDHIKKEYCK